MLTQLGIINIWAYIIGAILIILVPGPNSLFVLATSIKHDVRSGYLAACGIFVGDSLLILLAYLGVASLVSTSPMLFNLIQTGGAMYLFYLGAKILYGLIRQRETPEQTEIVETQSRQFFVKALTLSLTNPKAILFMMSFFIQFIRPDVANTGLPFLVLGSILMFINVTYLSVLIFGGASLTTRVKNKPWLGKLGNGTIGVLFIGFGLKLISTIR